MPTCPQGHPPLEPLIEGTREGSRCRECQGIWLPGRQVTSAIGATLPLQEILRLSRPTQRSCPEDDQKLVAFTHRGIEIDLCSQCGGVWLDAGELERLRTPIQLGAGWFVFEGLIQLLAELVASA